MSNIHRKPVNSSNLKSIGHDGKETLEVEFYGRRGKPDPIWRYQPVSCDMFRDLMDAESKGAFFTDRIKYNQDISSNQMVIEGKDELK